MDGIVVTDVATATTVAAVVSGVGYRITASGSAEIEVRIPRPQNELLEPMVVTFI